LTKDSICVLVGVQTLTKLSLSKGGDGWRKTFKISSKIISSHRKFNSLSLSDLLGYFKGLPEKNSITSLIPIKKKSQILFLYIFAIGCSSGESYERKFSEDAHTIGSKGFQYLFGAF